MSLVDRQQQRQVQEMQEEVLRDSRTENWEAAFLGWDRLINGDVTGPSFVQNVTGIQNYFNLLSPDYPTLDLWDKFLNQTSTRRALHVGDAVLHDGHEVEMHIVRDVMQSDGIHPASEGVALIVEAMGPIVADLVRRADQ